MDQDTHKEAAIEWPTWCGWGPLSCIHKAVVTAVGLVSLCLLPSLASAQVTFLQATSSTVGSGTTFSFTPDLTGANYMDVCIGFNDSTSASVSTITQNGVSLVSVGQAPFSVGYTAAMYRLASPTAGTFSVTFTASVLASITVMAWSGVDTTTPVGTAATNSGNGSNPSLVTSSASGEVVHDCVHSNVALTPDAGQTSTSADTQGIGGTYSSRKSGASPNVTTGWTTGDRWSIVGVSIKPASAGGGPPVGGRILMGVGR